MYFVIITCYFNCTVCRYIPKINFVFFFFKHFSNDGLIFDFKYRACSIDFLLCKTILLIFEQNKSSTNFLRIANEYFNKIVYI